MIKVDVNKCKEANGATTRWAIRREGMRDKSGKRAAERERERLVTGG